MPSSVLFITFTVVMALAIFHATVTNANTLQSDPLACIGASIAPNYIFLCTLGERVALSHPSLMLPAMMHSVCLSFRLYHQHNVRRDGGFRLRLQF